MNRLSSQNKSFLSENYFFCNIRACIFRKDALYDATPNFARLFLTALEKRTLLIYIHIEQVPATLK